MEFLATSLQGKELPDVKFILDSYQTTAIVAPTQPTIPGDATTALQINQSVLPTYNTRVKLRPIEFEEADIEGTFYNSYCYR